MTTTDKQFTGQQNEGTAFGVYNYGARFYSTVLGRFLSADPLLPQPGDPQLFDRYSYVRNNPLVFVDPSGLDGIGVDGTGQNAGDISNWIYFAIFYWVMYEDVPLLDACALWSVFYNFVIAGGSVEAQLAFFDFAIVSTSEADGIVGKVNALNHGGYVEKLTSLVASHPEIDTIIAFSLGAHVTEHFLANGNIGNVRRVLLIEAGDALFSDLHDPRPINGPVPGVNIMTWNGGRPYAYGANLRGIVPGVKNMTTFEAGEHSMHEGNPLNVMFAMWAIGDHTYLDVQSAANRMGITLTQGIPVEAL